MRPIDADELMEHVYRDRLDTRERIAEMVSNAPTIEAQSERNKGMWIYDGDCYICNKCGTTYSWWADSQTSNYCPSCGAKMKKGDSSD